MAVNPLVYWFFCGVPSANKLFGKLRISEISTKEIITWQNELLAYRDEKKKPYSQTYLKTLHEYYGAAKPPVRCGESHLSGLTEPPRFVY